MNDFYDPRRTLLADVGGLIGMAVGGVAASSLVWETLARGFKTGELEWAFLVFLAVVLGASALGGMLGLAGGRAFGRVWEERHRRKRPAPVEEMPQRVSGVPNAGVASPASPSAESHQGAGAAPMVYPGPPGVTLRAMLDDSTGLHALLERSGIALHHRPSAEHYRRSTAVGAWDGEVLIGAARVISGGQVTVLLDVVVDPVYRRRGIARSLVGAATSLAPEGVWHLGASSPESVAFLLALGAQRASDAWRLR